MAMRRIAETIGLLTVAALAAIGPSAPAAEGELPPGAVKVSGLVEATAREGGAVSAARLTAADGRVYTLVIDARGRSLATVMHRERAEVVGVASEDGGELRLRVLDYSDPRVTAAHELWRRMRCNACVVLPATLNAAAPRDLRGSEAVTGRYYTFREKYTAWARDARHLWLADDNALVQIDLDEAREVRRWGRPDGLPDAVVRQLVADGSGLWIVHRQGLAVLPAGGDRVRDLPDVRFRYARAVAGDGCLWVVADSGTFRLKGAEGAPEKLPAIPTADRLARAVEDGIWIPHWERRTAHFVASPAVIGERLYAASYGDVYELSGGQWRKAAEGAWDAAAGGGKLWYVTTGGLGEYDPEASRAEVHQPPESCRGRYSALLVTPDAAWLAAEPAPAAGGDATGGGLSRFDLAKREWTAFDRIGEGRTDRISCLAAGEGAVWAMMLDGKTSTKSAHPGMTTTKKSIFETTGMRLGRYDTAAGRWDCLPITLPELGSRLICGQDGSRGMDVIVPECATELSPGPQRVFAVTRLVPRKYFGGYWPCLDQVAALDGGKWSAAFVHRPEDLGLQGEQPLVLNISNGELTRIGSTLKDQLWEAVAQDFVLGMFVHNGRHWAVTEGGAARFDDGEGRWKRIAEPAYRWYWRATAALEENGVLYIGSDRGLVCRLDVATGAFTPLTALRERSIARIVRAAGGGLLVSGETPPLGVLPVFLKDRLESLDCDAARFDGQSWQPARPEDLPPAAGDAPRWVFRQFEKRDHTDKSQGNFLCEVKPGEAQPVPRYYVKEVFHPQFLCEGADGRIWLSTYTGLLRVDTGASSAIPARQ